MEKKTCEQHQNRTQQQWPLPHRASFLDVDVPHSRCAVHGNVPEWIVYGITEPCGNSVGNCGADIGSSQTQRVEENNGSTAHDGGIHGWALTGSVFPDHSGLKLNQEIFGDSVAFTNANTGGQAVDDIAPCCYFFSKRSILLHSMVGFGSGCNGECGISGRRDQLGNGQVVASEVQCWGAHRRKKLVVQGR